MTIYSIVGLMSLGQLLILSANSLKYLKKNVISRLFLVLMICLSFVLIHEITLHSRYILKVPHLTFTGEALTLVIWPLLYLISKEILNKKISSYELLHFLPFIIYTIYRFNDYSMSGSEKYGLLVDFYASLDSETLSVRIFSFKNFLYDFFLFRLQPLVYILLLLQTIKKYLGNQAEENNINSKKWLKILIYGFLIIWFIKYVLHLLGYFFIPISIKNPVAILFIAIEVFLISQLALTHKEGIPNSFIKKKRTTSKELQEIAEIVKVYINERRAFLNPELSLQILSKSINTNANYLSKAINTYHKKSFNDFINEFRVTHAKHLIESPKYELYTLDAIAKESGFKSISTFNRSFYKSEGMTPSDYKKLFNS